MPHPLTTRQLHIDLADLHVRAAVDLALTECPPLSRFVTHRTGHSHEASACGARAETGQPQPQPLSQMSSGNRCATDLRQLRCDICQGPQAGLVLPSRTPWPRVYGVLRLVPL